jgi:uncharacterized protein with beta-barrel porin domain
VRTGLFSVYGGYFDKELYLSGILAFGRNRYDTERTVTVGAVDTPISSNHEGNIFAAALSGGYYGRFGESFWARPEELATTSVLVV